MELCREHGFALLLAGGVMLRGWSLVREGDVAEGISQMRQGLTDWQATGALSHLPCHLALLAEALGRDGNTAEGLVTLTEAQALCSDLGECFYEPELHRLHGDLLFKHRDSGGDTAAAEAAYRQALAAARRQGAKLLELRAVTSLAHLLRGQGRFAEIRQPLADAYGWFTEGWETADLREAKAVVDEAS
jgi:predicted ATPase